ncbi:MAG: hypothetical protein FWC34_10160 [Bacteroidetes bacterium]|nr:hypothetical protein [Bacteroidota bacterium]MCL2302148.1 hypothetical protein [Lentimicrobiaceae bacterium]
MNKLFVLVTALVVSFSAMAQTSARAGQNQASTQTRPSQTASTIRQNQPAAEAKQDTVARARKSCADWVADGKCPKANEGGRCSDHKASGKCPRIEPKKSTKGKIE